MSALFHPYLCGRIAAEWLINMRKIFLTIAVCFLILCTGCKAEPTQLGTILFHSTDEIVRVEMVDSHIKEPEVIREISGEELESFIQDLITLECDFYWNDPVGHAGSYYIVVYYTNEDKERIGTSSIFFITADGEYNQPYRRDYYVKQDSMEKLFEKYCDIEYQLR